MPAALAAVLREASRVTPLELFFDLVFVLALTQCTALMADDPTWQGLAKGMLVVEIPALATVTVVSALLAALIAYETWRFAELRDRMRHQLG